MVRGWFVTQLVNYRAKANINTCLLLFDYALSILYFSC